MAADFDGEGWEKECIKCINVCENTGIPPYLERYPSGKGGHLWIFFKKSYPALRSRKIVISLLEQSGILMFL